MVDLFREHSEVSGGIEMQRVNITFALILLAIGWILAGPGQGWASCTNCSTSTAYCTAGTSVAQVNTCLSSLPDGGTINFAAGSYTWSGTITPVNGKGVSLIGAGAGSSNVSISGGSIQLQGSTVNKKYRISGFTFTGSPGAGWAIWFWPRAGSTLSDFRVDHNTFSNLGTGNGAILLGCASPAGGNVYGVIDHNAFTGTNNFMGAKVLGPGDDSGWRSSPKGTANNLFFEDNAFDFANASDLGSGCIDGWMSSSIVFRHNTTKNCLVTAHGVIHGGGVISFEVYDNTFTRTAGSGSWTDGTRLFHHQGSGELIMFNNQFSVSGAKSDGAIGMTYYRSANCSESGCETRCSGTQSIDGNWAPQSTYYGYPCFEQPGRMARNALSPMYLWNNRWADTGAKVGINIEDIWSGPPYVSTHIKANRDYYEAVSSSSQSSVSSPFNGTSGMGFGTLANRPATCTTNSLEAGGGVGYWATDTNTLYRCSATNSWTVHYRPYTYPHPLVQGGVTPPPADGSLSPPSNFRIL